MAQILVYQPSLMAIRLSLLDKKEAAAAIVKKMYSAEATPDVFSGALFQLARQLRACGATMPQCLCLVLRMAFDRHLIDACILNPDADRPETFEDIGVHELLEPAANFEVYSPWVESAATAVSEVYAKEDVLGARIIIVRKRLYIVGPVNDREQMDRLILASTTSKKATDRQLLLRRKLEIEKACRVKSGQILFAQNEANEVRCQFLKRFPDYVRESSMKKMEMVLGMIRDTTAPEGLPAAATGRLAQELCACAGAQAEVTETAIMSRLYGEDNTIGFDPEKVTRFVGFFSSEMMTLIKKVHPDKIGRETPDEVAAKIAQQSERLINLRSSLGKLGPGIRGAQVFLELRSIQAECALLDPQIVLAADSPQKEVDLEMEVTMMDASLQFLCRQLEAILDDEETAMMKTILEGTEELHNQYENELLLSIVSIRQRIEQLFADPTIMKALEQVAAHAKEISTKPFEIEQFVDALVKTARSC